MLNMYKEVTLKARSEFDGKIASGYQATIDSANPENMQLNNWIDNYQTYKTHREECSAERKQFEDAAYVLQEQMIAEKG